MKGMTFWYRFSVNNPIYVQDFDTWILLGNKTRMFNTHTKEWFVVDSVPSSEKALCKPHQHMVEVDFRRWLGTVGKFRGCTEVMEDVLHIRFMSRFFIHGPTKEKATPLRGAEISSCESPPTPEDIPG